MRRNALEEQRKADRERYRADIERERRERAVEEALSQRRTISILTGTVATLGILLALFAWQYIVAENSKTQLAELNARAREDADIKQKGAEALLLAQQAGKEREALREAIRAAGSSRQKGRPVPSRVMQGLAAAVATPVQRPIVLRHSEPITVADFSHDGTRRAHRQPRPLRPPVGRRVRANDPQPRRARRRLSSRPASRSTTPASSPSAADRNARLWNASSGDLLETLQGPRRRQTPLRRRGRPFGTRALLATPTAPCAWSTSGSPSVIEPCAATPAAITAAAFSPDGLAPRDRLQRRQRPPVERRGPGACSGPRHAPPRRAALRRRVRLPERQAHRHDRRGPHRPPVERVRACTSPASPPTPAILGAVFSPRQRHRRHPQRRPQRDPVGRPERQGDRRLTGHTDAVLDLSFSGRQPPHRHRQRRHHRQASGRQPAATSSSSSATPTTCAWPGSRPTARACSRPATTPPPACGTAPAATSSPPSRATPPRSASAGFSPDGTRVLTSATTTPPACGTPRSATRSPRSRATARRSAWPASRPTAAASSPSATTRRPACGTPPPTTTMVSTLDGHTGPVSSVVFSGEGAGRMITLAEDDPTLRLWDSQTGARSTPARHAGPVLAATFSRDGARMISAGADDTLRVWEVDTGVELTDKACQGMHGRVDFAAISHPAEPSPSSPTAAATAPSSSPPAAASSTSTSSATPAPSPAPPSPPTATSSPPSPPTTPPSCGPPATATTSTPSTPAPAPSTASTSPATAPASSSPPPATPGSTPSTSTTAKSPRLRHPPGPLRRRPPRRFSSNGARIVTASSDNTAKLWVATPRLRAHRHPPRPLRRRLLRRLLPRRLASSSPPAATAAPRSIPTTLEAFFKKACEALRSHDDPDFNAVASTCGGPSTTPPGATPGT
jgi:WD40 repeat protein